MKVYEVIYADGHVSYAVENPWSLERRMQQRRYMRLKRKALVAAFGGGCGMCGTSTKTGEFAHLIPTGLSGMGRGERQRLADIAAHPFAYQYMCKVCHTDFDREVGPRGPDVHRR